MKIEDVHCSQQDECFSRRFPFLLFSPLSYATVSVDGNKIVLLQRKREAQKRSTEEMKMTKAQEESESVREKNVFCTKCILHKNYIISICFFRIFSLLFLIAAVTHLLSFHSYFGEHTFRCEYNNSNGSCIDSC